VQGTDQLFPAQVQLHQVQLDGVQCLHLDLKLWVGKFMDYTKHSPPTNKGNNDALDYQYQG